MNKKESTTDVFGSSNGRTYLEVMSLEVEMHKLRSA